MRANYEEFIKRLEKEYENDERVKIERNVIQENHSVEIDRLLFRQDEITSINFNLNNEFAIYQNEYSKDDFDQYIADLETRVKENTLSRDARDIQNDVHSFNKVKDELILVPAPLNRLVTKDDDLVSITNSGITFDVAISGAILGHDTFVSRVRESRVKDWGVSKDEVIAIAKANLERRMESNKNMVVSLADMIRPMYESQGMPEEAIDQLANEMMEQSPVFYVSAYADKSNGSAVLSDISLVEKAILRLNKEFKRSVEEYVILPSSVHEVLIKPQIDGKLNEDEAQILMDMVRTVNETEVAENERLSDMPLVYNAKEKSLEPIDKYIMRTVDKTEEKKALEEKSIVKEDFTGHEYENEEEEVELC